MRIKAIHGIFRMTLKWTNASEIVSLLPIKCHTFSDEFVLEKSIFSLKIFIYNLKNCDKLSLSIKCYESFFAEKSNEYSTIDICLGAIATNMK